MSESTITRVTPKWKHRFGFGRITAKQHPQQAEVLVAHRVETPPPQESAAGREARIKVFSSSSKTKKESRNPLSFTSLRRKEQSDHDSYITMESDLEEKKVEHDLPISKGTTAASAPRPALSPLVIPSLSQKDEHQMDGFCRRVESYDGNVIYLPKGKATYEIGPYLGGGVAGVVFQGHRLLPMEEYPMRYSSLEEETNSGTTTPNGKPTNTNTNLNTNPPTTSAADQQARQQQQQQQQQLEEEEGPAGFFCGGSDAAAEAFEVGICVGGEGNMDATTISPTIIVAEDTEDMDTVQIADATSPKAKPEATTNTSATTVTACTPTHQYLESTDIAIETTISRDENMVLLDAQDAPSRSKHYSRAAGISIPTPKPPPSQRRGRPPRMIRNQTKKDMANPNHNTKNLRHNLTEEKVAIKILNPVGYRVLTDLSEAVVVRQGTAWKPSTMLTPDHVWWMVNPNSRNLRTLQRYKSNKNDDSNPKSTSSSSVQIDRGTPERGLRLSLIAGFWNSERNQLEELTLDKCIAIWGYLPFDLSDLEFEDWLKAIERVNAGHVGLARTNEEMESKNDVGRDRTGVTEATDSTATQSESNMASMSLSKPRTGLVRAAFSTRLTVYCEELDAYIGIPAVPSKYLRWLRQRRAATKEVRNMMSIGRHKNVLHLFEVLEFVQESKSTMFLILELVKGGELFDLISSSSSSSRASGKLVEDKEQAEQRMRNFFYELASGVEFCHKNGIAHRDLKPENLLVHTGVNGEEATLKIADFGLSATFLPSSPSQVPSAIANQTTLEDFENDIHDFGSPTSHSTTTTSGSFSSPKNAAGSPSSQASGSSIKDSMDKILASGANALSFLTCGAMETVLCIPTHQGLKEASQLRRMTSVVGSPHYVAPEIISQNESKKSSSKSAAKRGYDGAKADVWSAGVILYAMLFRSLPFGEDLLKCPRYQSYRKWYDEIRKLVGRRSCASAALNPTISAIDERDFLGPHWFFPQNTSKESRDLIVAMLNPKPEDRLTVTQVLGHPWLKGLSSPSIS